MPERAAPPPRRPPAGPGDDALHLAVGKPLQNQFAAWAFEYVAEGADVGEIEAIANDMASDDDDAYYEA